MKLISLDKRIHVVFVLLNLCPTILSGIEWSLLLFARKLGTRKCCHTKTCLTKFLNGLLKLFYHICEVPCLANGFFDRQRTLSNWSRFSLSEILKKRISMCYFCNDIIIMKLLTATSLKRKNYIFVFLNYTDFHWKARNN